LQQVEGDERGRLLRGELAHGRSGDEAALELNETGPVPVRLPHDQVAVYLQQEDLLQDANKPLSQLHPKAANNLTSENSNNLRLG
jgi:hypothetical protein